MLNTILDTIGFKAPADYKPLRFGFADESEISSGMVKLDATDTKTSDTVEEKTTAAGKAVAINFGGVD